MNLLNIKLICLKDNECIYYTSIGLKNTWMNEFTEHWLVWKTEEWMKLKFPFTNAWACIIGSTENMKRAVRCKNSLSQFWFYLEVLLK